MIVAFNTIQLKGIIRMSRAYVSKSLFEDDIYMWGLVFIKQKKYGNQGILDYFCQRIWNMLKGIKIFQSSVW